jgi:hypothetical protein
MTATRSRSGCLGSGRDDSEAPGQGKLVFSIRSIRVEGGLCLSAKLPTSPGSRPVATELFTHGCVATKAPQDLKTNDWSE